MNDLFPMVDVPPDLAVGSGASLSLYREYAWDFDRDEFVMKDGQLVLLEGQAAVQVWVYKALRTERYRYLAYTWDYGNEIERLIGSTFSPAAQRSEAERYVREALMVLPYIREVNQIEIASEGDELRIEATVETVYGEVRVRV